MHGLVNRSIQCFLRDTYGPGCWAAVARAAGVGPGGFETMLHYDDALTGAMLDAAAGQLRRPREAVLEDLGIYLISHPGPEFLRRLLRFGGVGFADFLHSLEDLPERGRLAVPDLDLPELKLAEQAGPGRYDLICRGGPPGIGHVVAGMLRAMADDYGALALVDHAGATAGEERISIHLLDSRFAAGRPFDLAAGPDPARGSTPEGARG
ncbi:MAG: heme NO-binding domain-containing protein [Gemmobacter sp.]